MRGQRRAILQVSKVIDIDERDDGLAMLGDRDGTVGVPGLGDKFPQVRPSRSQRIAGPYVKVYTLWCGPAVDTASGLHRRPRDGPAEDCGGVYARELIERSRGPAVRSARRLRRFDIFGFELSDHDVAEIGALNKTSAPALTRHVHRGA